jgi:excisionase family DNA binding protein
MKQRKLFLNSAEVAELLGVSSRTLQRKRDSGKIKFYQDGRIVRYSETDIIDYMESHAVEPFNEKGGRHVA